MKVVDIFLILTITINLNGVHPERKNESQKFKIKNQFPEDQNFSVYDEISWPQYDNLEYGTPDGLTYSKINTSVNFTKNVENKLDDYDYYYGYDTEPDLDGFTNHDESSTSYDVSDTSTEQSSKIYTQKIDLNDFGFDENTELILNNLSINPTPTHEIITTPKSTKDVSKNSEKISITYDTSIDPIYSTEKPQVYETRQEIYTKDVEYNGNSGMEIQNELSLCQCPDGTCIFNQSKSYTAVGKLLKKQIKLISHFLN